MLNEVRVREELPPGPGLPRVVQMLAWGVRPVPFLTWCQRRYGDVFCIRLPQGHTMVVVVDPATVKRVFTLPAEAFTAAPAGAILEPFLGARSLLLLDGERHRRERQVLGRAFHAEAMSHYGDLVVEATERDMATWPVGRPFPVRPHMQAITLDVIVRAVFGAESAEMTRGLGRFLRACGSLLILNPAWRKDFGRHSPWGRFVRLRAEVHQMVESEIAVRRRAPDLDSRSDMLSVLLRGDELDDHGLRDELITMLLAGHDTTASALAWAFDLIVHHPDVHQRLVESISEGDDRYLDAVVKETMRLRPVIAEAGRTLTRPTVIGGRMLPAGVSVTPSILLLQRRPDLYSDPLVFRPERFLEPSDPHTWIPFGGGIRRCLGAPFATLEIQVALRTVLRRMRLVPASRRPARPKRRAVTLTPRDGAHIIATPNVSGGLRKRRP